MRPTVASSRLIALGGLAIIVGGKIIGGIGVSGVTSDQDEQIAKAGVAHSSQEA